MFAAKEMTAVFESTSLKKFILAPLSLYLALFLILTWPAITLFSTHLFADSGDGFQCYWNLWWFTYAIEQLHTNPFFTNYLFYPVGTPLIAHTYSPLNGVVAALCSPVLSIGQIYNSIVIFSYVFGGWTAFSLAYYMSRSYLGSLLAGFLFAFSTFHFSHTTSHLQLVSLEWLPAYALMLIRLCRTPSVRVGILAAISLFFISLCDYYYCFYSLLLSLIVFIWESVRKRKLLLLVPEARTAWISFIAASAVSTGVVVGALLMTVIKDKLVGAHSAALYSMDLLAPFVPQRFWNLTGAYWSQAKGSLDEHNVYIGYVVSLMILFLVFMRKRLNQLEDLFLWLFITGFFWVMALGPHLTVGFVDTNILTPYWVLEHVLPILGTSGAPVRMIVMVTLGCAVLFAMGIALLQNVVPKPRQTFCFILISAFLLFDYLPKPKPITVTDLRVPKYVLFLRDAKKMGSVMDGGMLGSPEIQADPSRAVTKAMYHQTLHHKPLMDGYVSRFTQKTCDYIEWMKMQDLPVFIKQSGLRYLVLKNPLSERYSNDFKQVFNEDGVYVYEANAESENLKK